MTPNVPMSLPVCATPMHGEMQLSMPGTREQEWCGVWYRCNTCKSAVLFPRAELHVTNSSEGK